MGGLLHDELRACGCCWSSVCGHMSPVAAAAAAAVCVCCARRVRVTGDSGLQTEMIIRLIDGDVL